MTGVSMSQQKEMSKRQLRRQQIRRKETRGRLFGIGLVTLGAVFIAFLFIYPMFKPIAQVVTPQAISRPNVKANAAGTWMLRSKSKNTAIFNVLIIRISI